MGRFAIGLLESVPACSEEVLGVVCVNGRLELVRIAPADVGRYLDSMTVSTPTRKLHLAALRRFFDELVMRHVVILNPALVGSDGTASGG
jgi:hypothetical protein